MARNGHYVCILLVLSAHVVSHTVTETLFKARCWLRRETHFRINMKCSWFQTCSYSLASFKLSMNVFVSVHCHHICSFFWSFLGCGGHFGESILLAFLAPRSADGKEWRFEDETLMVWFGFRCPPQGWKIYAACNVWKCDPSRWNMLERLYLVEDLDQRRHVFHKSVGNSFSYYIPDQKHWNFKGSARNWQVLG